MKCDYIMARNDSVYFPLNLLSSAFLRALCVQTVFELILRSTFYVLHSISAYPVENTDALPQLQEKQRNSPTGEQ